MQDQKKSYWLADLALLASATMWGINIPVVKHATASLDPLVFNASRVVLSTLALGLLAWLEQRNRPKQSERLDWKQILFFTSLSGFLYSLLFMFGIQRTTAANAALLMSTMPMWTAILSLVFLGERLKAITWMGLGITIAGTIVVVSAKGQLQFSMQNMLGNVLILSAAFTWASATVVSRPLMVPVGPLRLAFISCALTTPLHWIVVSFLCDVSVERILVPHQIACLLYSGLLSTGLAYATWNFGVQKLGGSHASVYQNIVTLVAVLGGWVVLRESPLLAQILGGALMIVGLLIMRRGRS